MRRKLVVTGGPSGGKTTLIDMLQKEFTNEVAIVSEAASILYRGGFPRKKGPHRQKHAQRAIFFTQCEMEALIEEESRDRLIICDRGTLDSVAYWPEFTEKNTESFLSSIKSDVVTESNRYDWVLHLNTAPLAHYDSENVIRTESYSEAAELNSRILQAWSAHSKRIIVDQNIDFFFKMQQCIHVIKGLLQGLEFEEIKKSTQSPV